MFPEDQRSTFANYATIQNQGHEVHLTFFEIRPPIVIGTEDERAAILEKIDSIEAHCVSRIVMSTTRIPGLLKALQEQWARIEGALPVSGRQDND